MIRASRILVGAASVAALVALLGLGTWAVLPATLGWTPTVVMTGSMAPHILPGDVVVSAPFRPGDLAPGRVVLYADAADPQRLVVHRVTQLTDEGTLVTQGDANLTADVRPVRPDEVRGLPRLRVPVIGLPAVWLADGRWLPLVGAVVGATLLVHAALTTFAAAAGAPAGRHRAERRALA